MFSPGSPVRIMRASSVELSRSQDPVSSALAVRDRRSVVVDADRREGFNDEFTLSRGVAAERMDLGTPAEAAAKIKRVARGFGADLTGSSHRGHSFSRRVSSHRRRSARPGRRSSDVVVRAVRRAWCREDIWKKE